MKAGPLVARTVDYNGSTDGVEAIAEALKACPALKIGPAHAVVCHRDQEPVPGDGECDHDARRTSVFGDIRDRLRHEEVSGGFNRLRQSTIDGGVDDRWDERGWAPSARIQSPRRRPS